MKKLIQSLFNRKRVYSSNTIVRPMDFKYKPINSNPKKLGLEHSPNIKILGKFAWSKSIAIGTERIKNNS